MWRVPALFVHGVDVTYVAYPRAAAVLRQLADLIETAPIESDDNRDRFDQWLDEIRARLAHQQSLRSARCQCNNGYEQR